MWGREWAGRAIRFLELPAEAFGETKVQMVGRRQLTIENHRGLVAFSPHEVVVSTPTGRLVVTGQGFVIEGVRPDRLRIAGRIEEVRLTE